jgi:hypothetical protein
MAMATLWQHSDLEMLITVIARSQIVVEPAHCRPVARRLPAGFEAADIAILDWIAAEGRRVTRRYLPV